MKKFMRFAAVLIMIAVFVAPIMAAEQYFPGKNHTGNIGKPGKVWQGFYSDYLYLYGGTNYYQQFSGTPTADRTYTLPDNSVTLAGYGCIASHNYAATTTAWTLSASEAACGMIHTLNAGGAVDLIVPAAAATYGKVYFLYNGSGQTITVKTTGETASAPTIANAKRGLYVVSTDAVWEVYEQS